MANPGAKDVQYNAGGNTTSSTKGLQNIRGGQQGGPAADLKALLATETFARNSNSMLDTPYDGDVPDYQYGMPLDGNIPTNQEDTQGNGGWVVAGPGPGISQEMAVPGSKDPQPGGGW